MDSNVNPGSLEMLHLYMLDHMIEHNMNAAAYAFIGEAGLVDSVPGFQFSDGLLEEWWYLFWEHYNVRMYGQTSVGVTAPEFMARAQALTQIHAESLYEAQLHAEANALALQQVYNQALAFAQAQARAWALMNNGIGFYYPFDYVMRHTTMHPFPFFVLIVEMPSQLDTSSSDAGWMGPEHSSNHSRMVMPRDIKHQRKMYLCE